MPHESYSFDTQWSVKYNGVQINQTVNPLLLALGSLSVSSANQVRFKYGIFIAEFSVSSFSRWLIGFQKTHVFKPTHFLHQCSCPWSQYCFNGMVYFTLICCLQISWQLVLTLINIIKGRFTIKRKLITVVWRFV